MELDTLIYLNDLTLLHIWWWAILLITLQWKKKNRIYNWIIVNVGSQRLDCFNKFGDIDTSATEWSLCCFRHLLFLLYGMFSYTFYFFFCSSLISSYWLLLLSSLLLQLYVNRRAFVSGHSGILLLLQLQSTAFTQQPVFLISPVLGCFFSVVISAHFLQFRIP